MPFVTCNLIFTLHNDSSDYNYELHFRSLTTNLPHPRAAKPFVPAIPGRGESMIGRVQVAGSLVALLAGHDEDGCLEIWDWEVARSPVRALIVFLFLSHSSSRLLLSHVLTRPLVHFL